MSDRFVLDRVLDISSNEDFLNWVQQVRDVSIDIRLTLLEEDEDEEDEEDEEEIDEVPPPEPYSPQVKGGPGSGNWGHAGRSGKEGGSVGRGRGSGVAVREARKKEAAGSKSHERVEGHVVDIDREIPHLATYDGDGFYKKQALSQGQGDPVLADIIKAQGFDGPAEVVTREEMDAHIAEGGVEIWRGTKLTYQDYEKITLEERQADDKWYEKVRNSYNDQYREGEFYVGVGVYGNGVYASTDRKTAINFAERDDDNNIMRLSLKKDARIIDYEDAETLQQSKKDQNSSLSRNRMDRVVAAAELGEAAYDAEMVKIRAEEASSLPRERGRKELYYDIGRIVALEGYDAIRVSLSNDEQYYVILNRTATKVQRYDGGME